MKTLIYLLDVIAGTIIVSVRRLFKGKKRPNWTPMMEIAQMSMKKTLNRSLGEAGTDWFRNLQIQSSKSFKESPKIAYQYDTIKDIPVVKFTPDVLHNKERLIIYFHGGGYVYNSTAVHLAFLNDLCLATETKLLSVDYRLAPEFLFPTAHEDGFTVYQEIIKSTSAQNIILMGDSAGGAICTSILINAKKHQLPMPRAIGLISPWVNPYSDDPSIHENTPFDIGDKRFLIDCADKYLMGENKQHPYVAPIFADLSGFPKMLIQVGDAEMLLDQCKMLAEKATSDGVDVQYTEYKDLFHTALIASRTFKGCSEALQEIVEFVQS